FMPGSIRRVDLTNFLTYKKATFHVGPYLNMIIGPNGTGKSSFVCAVCLGLSGKNELLGRAKDTKSFVKSGCEEGSIEIELQGQQNEGNVIIKRIIYANGNSSLWRINGKLSNTIKVRTLVASYNIQIDNLCQFLPQDKVSEFAKLDPVKLLHETERAVGSTELVAQHEELKQLDNKVGGIKVNLESMKAELERLSINHEKNLDIMRQFEERVTLQKQLATLKAAKLAVYHGVYLQKRKVAVNEFNALKEVLRKLELENEPLKNQSNLFRKNLGLLLSEQTGLKQKLQTSRQNSIEKKARLQELMKKQDLLDEKLEEIHNNEKEYQNSLENLQKEVSELQRKWESTSRPDTNVYDALISQRDNFTQSIREIEEKISDMEEGDIAISCRNKLDFAERQVRTKSEDLHRLSTINPRITKLLQDRSINRGSIEDMLKAVDYIKKNRDQFTGTIWEPPCLSVGVKDSRYRKYADATIFPHRFVFTCETRSDYEKFTKHAFEVSRWNITVAEYSNTAAPTLNKHRKPTSNDSINSLGFDGYIVDTLTGPEPVLNMLCHKAFLHMTPFALRELTRNQQARLESALTDGTIPLIKKYFVGDNQVLNVRSKYGKKNISTNSSVVWNNHASIFAIDKVDDSKIAQVQRELEEATSKCNQCKDALKEIQQKSIEYKRDISSAKKKRQQIYENIQAYKESEQIYEKLKTRLNARKQKYEEMKHKPPKTENEIFSNREKFARVTELSVNETISLASQLADEVKSYQQASTLALAVKVANNNMNYVEKVYEISNERSKRIRETELPELRIRSQDARALSDSKEREFKNAIKDFDEESINEIRGIADEILQKSDPVAIVESQIETKQSELSMQGQDGDNSIVKRVQDEKARIDTLKNEIENITTNHSIDIDRLNKLGVSWSTELRRLVDQVSTHFSEAFESINCGGKVEVTPADRYDNWKIEIKVRFRETEELQLLDSHRQSGGERSLTTIFYLMSLQGLTRSPFRVVDEINQGMDPRNERIVHSRMVDIGCKENTSQYFLITPKLLLNLNYHRRMKVHCIFSGAYMPSVDE
ncbi:P-loop containing nucleoside triphosphate hydrolase protein, partial [Nadsonia fulvescens var. elongata DSM 6958]